MPHSRNRPSSWDDQRQIRCDLDAVAAVVPNVAVVAERWRSELKAVIETSVAGPDDAVEIGRMLEYLVGFDLSSAVPYGELLRYLHPAACTDLLVGAGFRRRPSNAAREHDDLHGWERKRPELLDASAMLPALWQLAKIEGFLFSASSALDWIERHGADDVLTSTIGRGTRRLMVELWENYQTSGRASLLELGDPAGIRPEFHPRRGVGDLVVGHTLIDIKAKTNPLNDLDTYAAQLLKYALFDEDDRYSLDTVGLYFGYQPVLVTQPLSPEALRTLSDGRTGDLTELRREFARIRPS